MQESLLPRVSETLGSSSLVDLILTRAENQTDGKQMQQKIMQEFQDFDNEGFDGKNAFLLLSRTQNYVSWRVEKYSYLDSSSQINLVLPIGWGGAFWSERNSLSPNQSSNTIQSAQQS